MVKFMQDDYKMTDKFEYKGMWWLPDNPTNQIAGTLRFSPDDGAILDLQGNFKDINDINNISAAKIILGNSFDGENISLHGCHSGFRRTRLLLPSTASWLFDVGMVFIGAHLPKKEDAKFKNICIHYSHLDEWVGISGFDRSLPVVANNETVIKYKLPEPILANIDDYKISICFAFTPPSFSYLQKEATIKQKVYIKIESSEERSLNEYWKIIYHISNFLSLGVMGSVYPLFVEGTTETTKVIKKNNITHYPPVEIYYKEPDMPKVFRNIMPDQMHFTFGDIRDRFESFLQNWFKKIDLLEPVYDLYFGTLHNSLVYLNKWFLDLVYAIESYHSRKYGGMYLSNEEFKPTYDTLIRSIPGGIGGGLRDKLKNYLKYGNRFSLRKRLEDIYDKHQIILNSLIHDKDKSIEDIVNTRNYLTHFDEELKDKAKTGNMLFFRIKDLKIMIEVCLLIEVGFTQEEILRLFGRCRKRDREFMPFIF